MERKEFNSVEEAIESLNSVRNIDYSSVDNVGEITEREFYNNLMNNFMGTRNIRFTAEQRRNYQEALRKKGLLSYADWKRRQPNRGQKVTWKDSVEKGSLDVPVNLFSKLVETDDERKFEYIKEVATDERKSDVGIKWLDKSAGILKDLISKNRDSKATKSINADTKVIFDGQSKGERILSDTQKDISNFVASVLNEKEKQKQRDNRTVDQIMAQSEKDLSNFVNDILEERKAQGQQQYAKKRGITKKQEFDDFFTKSHRNFRNHDEVIQALNSIKKIDFDRGPSKEEQQRFYYDVMQTLEDANDLEIPDGGEGSDIAFQYRQALGNIGCKTMKELKVAGAMNRSVKRPAKVIDSILNSRRHNDNKGFRTAVDKLRDDYKLRDWIDDTKITLLDRDERKREKLERREKFVRREEPEEREKEKYPVPVTKKRGFSSIKKAFTRAGIATLAFLGVTVGAAGSLGSKTQAEDVDEKVPKPLKIEDQKDNKSKDKVKENKKLENNLKDAGINAQSFEDELRDSTNYVGGNYYNYQADQNYTVAPNSHTEQNTQANEKEAQIRAEEDQAEQEAIEAKEEIADVELEVVMDGNNEIGEIVDSGTKAPETVVVGNDGSTDIQSPVTLPGDGSDSIIEDDREVEDMGEISFGDEDFSEDLEEEDKTVDDDYTR